LSQTLLSQIKTTVLMRVALPGVVVILYPTMARGSFQQRSTLSHSGSDPLDPEAASGAISGTSEDELSSDCEESLPDVLTRSTVTQSKWKRETALAEDHFLIDSKLALHSLEQYLPKHLTLCFQADTSGVRMSGKALVRRPALDRAASGALSADMGVNATTLLENSVCLRDGILVDIPCPTEFIDVSKKLSYQCRKSQAQHWRTDGLMVTSKNYISNKGARCQMGWQAYYSNFIDLIKNCRARTLVINDLIAGVGEAGAAAVRAKNSPEAQQSGVRVCYWVYEERRVVAQIGRANVRAEVGAAFVAGDLRTPGFELVPAPPSQAASGASKSAIEAKLRAPSSQLSMRADGSLAIPTEQELQQTPPPGAVDGRLG